MQYSVEEIKQYAAEEDVKFIRMAFCDAAGRQKNIAIMPRNWTGPSSTVLPSTAPPFPASVGRSTLICCCARIRPPSVCCPGGRSMDGWCGCSAP